MVRKSPNFATLRGSSRPGGKPHLARGSGCADPSLPNFSDPQSRRLGAVAARAQQQATSLSFDFGPYLWTFFDPLPYLSTSKQQNRSERANTQQVPPARYFLPVIPTLRPLLVLSKTALSETHPPDGSHLLHSHHADGEPLQLSPREHSHVTVQHVRQVHLAPHHNTITHNTTQ